MLPADLQLKPQYHEEELTEVYETHKQVRSKMNEMKKTKGFRSYGDGSRGQRPWKLTGSISAQIEQAKRVSRGEGVICANILGSHVRTGTVFGTWGHLRTHVGVTSTHKCFLGSSAKRFGGHMYTHSTYVGVTCHTDHLVDVEKAFFDTQTH